MLVFGQSYQGNEARVVIFDSTSGVFTFFYSTVRTEVLAFDQVVTGQVLQPGDVREYAFSGVPGQQVWLEQFTLDAAIAGGATISLRAPSGKTIAINAIAGSGLNTPVMLNETGTYRVVFDAPGEAIGNYQFRLRNLTAATVLAENQLTTGQLKPGSETRTYQINGNVGQRLAFDWQGAATSDVRWFLYGPTGQLVASPTANIADFAATLTLKGTYTLVLQSLGASAIDYSFQVSLNLPTVLNTGLGVIYSGSIGTQTDSYTFTAVAGTKIYVDSLGNSNSGIRINQPDGGIVWNASANSNQLLVLQQSGTYTVYFGGTSSQYNVRLLELPFETPDPRGNNRVLQIGVPARTTIQGSETEFYSFTGKVGQVIRQDGLPGLSGGTNNVALPDLLW
jgi:large repetitive protein